MTAGIRARKDDHIEIAASGRGSFRETSTLLNEVRLVHQALPELALDDIDLTTNLFGRRLSAPILIGAMTGGTDEAARINVALAKIASELGLGLFLGSQRVMLEAPGSRGFQLRDIAPDVLLIGNIGLVQAREIGVDGVADLADAAQVDAMAIHLNVAQELVQADGDRSFRGCIEALSVLARELPVPVLVKETGCGLSREAGSVIANAGVGYVDVGGAGGTSWVRVEAERDPSRGWLGDLIGEWGIPTAGSLLLLDGLPLVRIAGGGIRSGLDVARAMALGAAACSIAQPVLEALMSGGERGAKSFLGEVRDGLRAVSLLTGCRSPRELPRAPKFLGEELLRWKELADQSSPTTSQSHGLPGRK